MIRQFAVRYAWILCVMSSLFACLSSEESGTGARAKGPVQIFGPIDTAHHVSARRDSANYTGNASKVAPKFKSKQDTVRASVVKKSRTSSKVKIKIERPEHPIYTVQIGAFRQASNALRMQKKAKQRFMHQPVFNRYIKSARVYRVSIGRYKDRNNAFALADTMKQNYTKEYGRCWINFIP